VHNMHSVFLMNRCFVVLGKNLPTIAKKSLAGITIASLNDPFCACRVDVEP